VVSTVRPATNASLRLPPALLAAALAAVAVALSLTTTAAAATRHHRAATRCAGAHRRIAGTAPTALKAAVVCLINQQRTGRGLPALHANQDLDHSAQGWTTHLVRSHQFTHGADFASRITRAGFHWSAAGENIATGYPTPSAVVRAWMGSTGHCQNILDPSYRAVGTGVSAGAAVTDAPGTWTQDFALRMGQRPASGNTGPESGCPYR
jgi:uncharacterized protein YkwD